MQLLPLGNVSGDEMAEASGADLDEYDTVPSRYQEEGPRSLSPKALRVMKRAGLVLAVFLGVAVAGLGWPCAPVLPQSPDINHEILDLMSTQNEHSTMGTQQNAHTINNFAGNDHTIDTRVRAKAWYHLGQRGGGDVDHLWYDSKSCYQQALHVDKTYSPAWIELGRLNGGYSHGKHWTPKECYRQAVQHGAYNAQAWYELGRVDGGDVQGKHYTAKSCFVQAILQNKTFVPAWIQLGLMNGGVVDEKQYESEDCFENALRNCDMTSLTFITCDDGSAARALCNLGNAVAKKGGKLFAKSIAEGLSRNKWAKEVDFLGNDLPDEDVLAIVKALSRNAAIRKLEFRGKEFSDDVVSSATEMVSPSLQLFIDKKIPTTTTHTATTQSTTTQSTTTHSTTTQATTTQTTDPVPDDFSTATKHQRTSEEYSRATPYVVLIFILFVVSCMFHAMDPPPFEFAELQFHFALKFWPLIFCILNWCGLVSAPVLGEGLLGYWSSLGQWSTKGIWLSLFLVPLAVLLFFLFFYLVVVFGFAYGDDCVYRFVFLALAGVFVGWNALVRAHPLFFSWVGLSPLANVIASFVGDYAISMATVFFPCFVLPYHAFVQKKIFCHDGTDWEVHAAFACACVMQSLTWACMMAGVRRHLSWFSRVFVFITYVAAMTDVYMDGHFLVVASACGSTWHMQIASWTYALGLIALQSAVGTLAFSLSEGNRAYKYVGLGYPLEVTTFTSFADKNLEGGRSSAWLVLASCLAHCIGEDLLQAAIQYDFIQKVAKNPMVIFSIASSVVSFFFQVVKALRIYFKI